MVPPDPATESVERLRRQALRLLTETGERFDDPASQASAPRDEAQDCAARPPGASSMIAGLIAMPAAFLAVVFIAIAIFGKPGDADPPAAGPAPEKLAQPASLRAASPMLASATQDFLSAIPLGEDARIASIALDGDRVALNIESPTGREIIIYDYRAGRQVGAARIETIRTAAVDTLGMLTGPPPAAATPLAPAEPPAAAEAPTPRALPASAPRQKPAATP